MHYFPKNNFTKKCYESIRCFLSEILFVLRILFRTTFSNYLERIISDKGKLLEETRCNQTYGESSKSVDMC